MALARRTIAKALEIDPELPEAHTILGSIETHGAWNFERAEEHFEHALALDPGLVIGHQQLGIMLAYTGRLDEATAQMEIAKDLDPLTADPAGVDLGRLYELGGDPERAVAYWTETAELAPRYAQPMLSHGEYLCRRGEAQPAIELLERAAGLVPGDSWFLANLGHCLGVSGRTEEARAVAARLAEFSVGEYVDPVGPALVHVALGETEASFAALERAFELRSMRILLLTLDPRWEPLHDDPRYADLVERIGLASRRSREATARRERFGG
jgi:tetratricopeptide (TPR) repeat protein